MLRVFIGEAVVMNLDGASGLAMEFAKSFAVGWLLERVYSRCLRVEVYSLSNSASSMVSTSLRLPGL